MKKLLFRSNIRLFSTMNDSSTLSSAEINQILRKKPKSTIKILHTQEVPIEDPTYDQSIEEKLSNIKPQ